ncbi:transcription factor ORG3-like [Mercurialis annua]|uniref:transcription factor ORG3-like n=1 Tax=Mercurialis annua TaxID=3986 RepID=UPI00215E0755|nr:transcription factor ORG3-like [Mercurialis annua]
MLALSPPHIFPNFGFPLEESIAHDLISYFSTEIHPTPKISSDHAQQNLLLDLDHQSTSFTACNSGGDPNTNNKKLNHNASERNRRKKMNALYYSLRSLIPASSNQMKKLSIPATLSRVLTYIPELRKQLAILVRKKEELLFELSKQDPVIMSPQINRRKGTNLSVVSANQLDNEEIFIQISTHKNVIHSLSEILLVLKEEGLLLINSSSFVSLDGKVFYNLHFQVERTYKLDSDALSKKLESLYESR